MPLGRYRVQIADLDDTLLEEVPAKNLQYTEALNEPGSVSFVLPRRHAKTLRSTLEPGQRQVWVYEENTRVWGGYLWQAVKGSGSEDSADQDIFRFSGLGYLSRLDRRIIKQKRTFSATDQLSIVWTLIDDSQSLPGGDLGITRFNPSETSDVNRARTYNEWETKNLGEAIRELAFAENGFDFEIDANKNWKTYYPTKGIRTSHVFDLGKNIRGIGYELDAHKVATEIIAIGAGEGQDMRRSVAADSAGLTTFGLLHDTISHKSVSVQATLDAKAQDELRLKKVSREGIQISVITDDPPLGSYVVGDEVRVRADIGFDQIDRVMRVVALVVQVSDEGNKVPTVFFGEVA